MQFYFQSGEFYGTESVFWKVIELLVTFLGIVAGAWVAIRVFQLEKKHEQEKEKLRLEELQVFINNSVKDIIDPLNRQLTFLKKFSEELSKPGMGNYKPETVVSLNSKIIRWISYSDLYKILVIEKDRNSEIFKRFNADLDFIDSIGETLPNTFKYFMSKYEIYEKEWQENIRAIGQIRDVLAIEFETNQREGRNPDYPFLIAFDRQFAAWVNLDNYRELHIAAEHFLGPLVNICRETLKNSSDKNALAVLNYSNNCLLAFENITTIRSFVKDSIDFMIDQLEKIEIRFEAWGK